jgi:uncharacterized protein RhaS with RHS repeats
MLSAAGDQRGDPFGRTASIGCDGAGQAQNITDSGGLTSSFSYDPNHWITNMVTPDGTTPQADNGKQQRQPSWVCQALGQMCCPA